MLKVKVLKVKMLKMQMLKMQLLSLCGVCGRAWALACVAGLLGAALPGPLAAQEPDAIPEIEDHSTEGYATLNVNTATAEHLPAVPSALADKSLLLDVAQAGERLVAVGEYGHVILSDDHGATWTQADMVPTRSTLTSVVFPTDQVGYAGGHDSVIIKTTDAGRTWEMLYAAPEAETPVLTMHFTDENTGLAMGAFSSVLRTTDGGVTWTAQELFPGNEDDLHLNGLFSDDNGNLYVAAEFGVVYKSTDGGRTFAPLQTPYEGSFWGGQGLGGEAVLVYGMRGNAWRSDDAGQNWRKLDTGIDKSFGGITRLSDGTIVLVGLNGVVAYSDDGGESFQAITRPDRLGYSAVAPGPDGRIVLFGEPGVRSQPDSHAAAREALDGGPQ